MIRIELRPSPGLDATEARWLDRHDFELKTVERPSPDAPAVYVLLLDSPLPGSTKVRLHLQLEASGEIDINLVDVSVKESVLQFDPGGRVEAEE